jgi:hypothetical protein
MPSPASLPPDQYVDVLNRLPADLNLNDLARQTKAIERGRVLDDGALLLRLLLARGPGGLSLNQTAAWASILGLTEMSDPAIKYRLDKAVGFLNALVERQLAGNTTRRPIRWPGRILRLADGSSISKPGSKGTDWRVHCVYDLGRGGFSHLALTDSHGAEGLCRGAPVPGEVRIADRNYARLKDLREFLRQGNGLADFIVRLRWRSLILYWPDGTRFDLFEYLRGLPPGPAPHEIVIHARDSGRAEASLPPLPLRLIVLRKSPEATEAERKRLRQTASRKQSQLDPRSLEAAEFVMLATSLTEIYAAEDIIGAYRLRWQVELAIKRTKSLIHIDELPTRTPQASRSWLLSHVLLATLTDEMTQDLLDSFPCGSE